MLIPRQKLSVLYLGGDLLTLLFTFFISAYFFSEQRYRETDWLIFSGVIVSWFLIGYWNKLYYFNLHVGLSVRFLKYVKACFFLITLILIFYTVFPFSLPSKKVLAAFVMGFPALGLSVNFLLVKLMAQAKKTKEKARYALVAGTGNLAENVEKQLYAQYKSTYQVKGFINCKKKEISTVGQERIVGNLEHIHSYLTDNPVDEIIIALPFKRSKKIKAIMSAADYHGVRVKFIPDYEALFGEKYKTKRYGRMEAVNVRQLPLDERYALFLKNCFDKIFSLLALMILFPFFLFIAILIKLDSPGPIFYCPTRIGRAGKPFKVYKFRSMRENDVSSGGLLSTQKGDYRITRLGKILRKYSLDELPQFLNVLLGNMSVVGPRPHRSFLNQQFQESVKKYMIRHYFKPGITGWAQVNGWRGPTDTHEQKSQRTLHDLWYIENWSLWLDIKIVYLTIFSRKAHKAAF